MNISVGDTYSKFFLITDTMVEGFALVTGDINPIHLDEEYAKTTKFKKRVAHGLLIGSLISSVIGNDYPGSGTIYMSQTLKFLKPVYIQDKLEILIEVIEINRNNWVKLKTECRTEAGRVITGEAIVIPSEVVQIK